MPVQLTSTTDLDFLVPALRMHLGDITEPYAYDEGLLKFSLLEGIKMLMARWNYRYSVVYDQDLNHWSVTRNNDDVFQFSEPPVIQYCDERPIVLAAAILLKTGTVYTSGADAVSWKDDEISFSNVAGAELKSKSLLSDLDELNKLVPERRQRLARPTKQSLLGFRNPPNEFEG